jgi:hypothetical protein
VLSLSFTPVKKHGFALTGLEPIIQSARDRLGIHIPGNILTVIFVIIGLLLRPST